MFDTSKDLLYRDVNETDQNGNFPGKITDVLVMMKKHLIMKYSKLIINMMPLYLI